MESAVNASPATMRYLGWTRLESAPTTTNIAMVTTPPGERTRPAQNAV